MELPIDHFRLLGVSPSAQAEAVLRAFQLRLDKAPDQGFTHEVLLQRAELLRSSADLLTDETLRQDYETALLGGASGLELSSNREVAGLILLWEADACLEAFNLARKALQPPQTPALGSGREADLTLAAALSCQAAAQQEQEQRHYQAAALLLQEGIQLLQRMGKLQDLRQTLENELENLIPYRILDLVSRDFSDQDSHQEGLKLLDAYVRQRGGLEGGDPNDLIGGLVQSDFVLFFQQIRKFLTVQEQLDLFVKWQKRGSSESGFLGVIALVAAGFSQRKPERLQQARKYLKSLELQGLDKFPLLGCMDLLLADIKQAEGNFRKSSDEGLKNWLEVYPGETLAALCDYCRDWLKRDVLLGYRDVESDPVDLEAWFADRDVQTYVESLEKKGALGIAKSSFSFLSSFSGEKPEVDDSEEDLESNTNLPMPGGVPDYEEEETDFGQFNWQEFFHGRIQDPILKILSKRTSSILGASLGLLLVGLGASLGVFDFRDDPLKSIRTNNQIALEEPIKSKPEREEPLQDMKKPELNLLIASEPSEEEIKRLIQFWLNGKAKVLAGQKSEELPIVARPSLIERVQLERTKDLKRKEIQRINTSINSFKLVSQTPKRIEVKVKLSYSDQRLKSTGEIVSETSIPSLKVTYILGREKNLWQLVDYISGS